MGSVRALPPSGTRERSSQRGNRSATPYSAGRSPSSDSRSAGSRVERLGRELCTRSSARKVIAFRPPVYLSDQWGCPDGTPLIGVPFYLVDDAARAHRGGDVGGRRGRRGGDALSAARVRARRQLRVQAVRTRRSGAALFGSFSRPYRERYRADPFSREYVRHILGWYAQKHPDEDFAETFAVWLTPGLDWRREYAGWPALAKLEYVDRVMHEIGSQSPDGRRTDRRRPAGRGDALHRRRALRR